MATKIVFLDRVLANYGSETANTRELLRESVGSTINHMWPDKKLAHAAQLDPSESSGEVFFNSIQNLSPQNDVQRSLKSQAAQIAWISAKCAGCFSSRPIHRYPLPC